MVSVATRRQEVIGAICEALDRLEGVESWGFRAMDGLVVVDLDDGSSYEVRVEQTRASVEEVDPFYADYYA